MSHLNPATGGATGRDRISIMNLASNGAMPSRRSENSGRWSALLSILNSRSDKRNTSWTGHPGAAGTSTFTSYSGQLADRYLDCQILTQPKLTLSPPPPRAPGRTTSKSCSNPELARNMDPTYCRGSHFHPHLSCSSQFSTARAHQSRCESRAPGLATCRELHLDHSLIKVSGTLSTETTSFPFSLLTSTCLRSTPCPFRSPHLRLRRSSCCTVLSWRTPRLSWISKTIEDTFFCFLM
jgi:hypothetical protein